MSATGQIQIALLHTSRHKFYVILLRRIFFVDITKSFRILIHDQALIFVIKVIGELSDIALHWKTVMTNDKTLAKDHWFWSQILRGILEI